MNPLDPAPWWGVPVIAGGFLLVGGVLTFLYTYLFSDRRKSRIESHYSWESRLIEAVSSMETAASEYRKWVIANHRNEVERTIYGDERSDRAALVAAWDDTMSFRGGLAAVETQLSILTIIAEPVGMKAAKLHDALWKGGSIEPTVDALDEWDTKVSNARVWVLAAAQDMVTARRLALGLTSLKVERKADRLMTTLQESRATPEAAAKSAYKPVDPGPEHDRTPTARASEPPRP